MSTVDDFALPQAKPTGHPGGLYVLFFSEAWERFSYYGMRALLVIYLTDHLKYTKTSALTLYATYTGLVYLTPLLGGFLADKVLGQRKAILVGGILMALGHFAMAFEERLYLALSLLILGNGFFKPNISTMVGNLYPQGDSRRDGAYTIFYMGINLGAFISPLLCGWLGENKNWGYHYGFGLAGVGMVLGLMSFLFFQGALRGGYPPGREELGRGRLEVMDWVHVIGVVAGFSALALGASLAWPTLQPYSDYLLPTIAVGFGALLVYVFFRAMATKGTEEGPSWQRIAVILIVSLFSVVFWMGFEQSGGTLSLFAKDKTDRSLFGSHFDDGVFPASYFQSINPLMIILLAPLFSALWTAIDRTRFKVTSSAKMGLGLVILGGGFVVMNMAEKASAGGAKVGPGWLFTVFTLFTVAELCLSPIGLSLVNKLAEARAASMLMAVWFLCTAVANYLAGRLETLLEMLHKNHGIEINLWVFLIASSVIPGLMLLALTVPLKKMSHGRL